MIRPTASAHANLRVPVLAWMLGASLLLACSREGSAPEGPPLVVVVVIDTLRADRLAIHGRAEDPMPFLGELASQGVLFERALAPSSWTAPSTASLFTGVYPRQHRVELGLWLYQQAHATDRKVRLHRIPSSLDTLPQVMRSAGYRTFGVTDNPNIAAREGFERGFDRFQNFDYAGAARVNETLAGWRDEIRASERAFVYLHFMEPHEPYHRRARFYRAPPDESPRSQVLARYDSELRYLDLALRRAFALIGVDQSSAVIVAADHGEAFYDRGQTAGHLGHGFQLYSELVHVTLIVRDPGVEVQRRRVDRNVSLVDVLPTLRDIVGREPAEQDAGISLRPYYSGGRVPEERAVFSMREEPRSRGGARKHAVVLGSLKWIATRGPMGEPRGEEIYDLSTDQGERRNLAGRGAAVPEAVAPLREAWRRFLLEAPRWEPEVASETLSTEEAERLRALGYVEP